MNEPGDVGETRRQWDSTPLGQRLDAGSVP